MRTQQPEVTLKTDPDQNRVVRDGNGLPVSSLRLYLGNNGCVEMDVRSPNGYTPVTIKLTRTVLTDIATQWLRLDAAKRLLKKWRKAKKPTK